MSELPDHVRRNRAYWDGTHERWIAPGDRSWASNDPKWGIWQIPEADVGMLPDDLDGKDAIELGCGTAYVSSWMARRGARVVGIDNSEMQLSTARRFQEEHDVHFPLLHGNAETVPYPDESFDFAISEYGACLWADPYAWIPEAARLLRPGGRLHFLTNSFLVMLCAPDDENLPATDRLLRPLFGLHRTEWPSEDSVEFHLPHGEWIRLLRTNDFEIDGLVELRPPDGSVSPFDPFVSLEWAQQWPCEEAWKVRKR